MKSIELSDEVQKKRLMDFYNNGVPGQDKINEIIKIYKSSGAINYAKKDIQNYTMEANSYLLNITNPEARNRLEKFSEMLLKRNY